MKLVRFGKAGAEKPGIIDGDGVLRDLSRVVKDITPATLADGALAKIKKANVAKLPKVSGKPRLGPVVGNIGKLICIGLNYADHAAETGAAVPKEPIFFLKANSAISGPNDTVAIPRGSVKCDWECELAVIIGRKGKYIPAAKALDYVVGYTICNDVSEREYQMERGPTWTKGKSCDGFGPLGPWFVTKDEVKDPQKLKMWTDVSGVRRQNGSTATMIFDVRQLIEYCSSFFTLYPGDVISTGTPPGVAAGMKPEPKFLRPGDTVTCGIEGLGQQTQKYVAHK
jgi:2-keto-4-pentenoate hydratase/2-oxohepta-3-ene-1,7-dioic acid hydratase in catechol pathway